MKIGDALALALLPEFFMKGAEPWFEPKSADAHAAQGCETFCATGGSIVDNFNPDTIKHPDCCHEEAAQYAKKIVAYMAANGNRPIEVEDLTRFTRRGVLWGCRYERRRLFDALKLKYPEAAEWLERTHADL